MYDLVYDYCRRDITKGYYIETKYGDIYLYIL